MTNVSVEARSTGTGTHPPAQVCQYEGTAGVICLKDLLHNGDIGATMQTFDSFNRDSLKEIAEQMAEECNLGCCRLLLFVGMLEFPSKLRR